MELGWFVEHVVEKYNYWMAIILMLIGLYGTIAKDNLIKKLIGLNIFQTAIILFFISLGDVREGTAPIIKGSLPWGTHEIAELPYKYANPLPQVLMLTAIVVMAATAAVALALIIRIYEKYGTIQEEEILEKEIERARGERSSREEA